jgi:hypothetical protein
MANLTAVENPLGLMQKEATENEWVDGAHWGAFAVGPRLARQRGRSWFAAEAHLGQVHPGERFGIRERWFQQKLVV